MAKEGMDTSPRGGGAIGPSRRFPPTIVRREPMEGGGHRIHWSSGETTDIFVTSQPEGMMNFGPGKVRGRSQQHN